MTELDEARERLERIASSTSAGYVVAVMDAYGSEPIGQLYSDLRALIGGGGVPAGWQPIETAPKDTWILLANGKVVSSGRFRKHDVFRLYGFIRDGAEMPDESITHWMPLPDAPASTVEG